MQVYFDLEKIDFLEPTCLSIGSFDGVHLGHQYLLKKLVNTAKSKKLNSLVVTFDPHPRKFFGLEGFSELITLDKKIQLLENTNVTNLVVLKFDYSLANLNAIQFLDNILLNKLKMQYLLVGQDFCFGKNRQGNIDFLTEMSKKRDFQMEILKKYAYQNFIPSSSTIRQLVSYGDFNTASKLLGWQYCHEDAFT